VKLPVGPGYDGGIARLLIEKRGGESASGTGHPGSYLVDIQTIDDLGVAWNSEAERWEVTFQTTGFSGFFVKITDNPLPVRWISFEGRLNDQQNAQLQWKVYEQDVSYYEIERSGNARDFTKVMRV
jgi:hypothetical protein